MAHRIQTGWSSRLQYFGTGIRLGWVKHSSSSNCEGFSRDIGFDHKAIGEKRRAMECKCGRGESVSNASFRPGHDQRLRISPTARMCEPSIKTVRSLITRSPSKTRWLNPLWPLGLEFFPMSSTNYTVAKSSQAGASVHLTFSDLQIALRVSLRALRLVGLVSDPLENAVVVIEQNRRCLSMERKDGGVEAPISLFD